MALLHCVKYFRIYYFYRLLKRKRARFLNFSLKEIKIDLFPCSNLEIKIKNIMLACHFVFQIFGQRKYFFKAAFIQKYLLVFLYVDGQVFLEFREQKMLIKVYSVKNYLLIHVLTQHLLAGDISNERYLILFHSIVCCS